MTRAAVLETTNKTTQVFLACFFFSFWNSVFGLLDSSLPVQKKGENCQKKKKERGENPAIAFPVLKRNGFFGALDAPIYLSREIMLPLATNMSPSSSPTFAKAAMETAPEHKWTIRSKATQNAHSRDTRPYSINRSASLPSHLRYIV